MKKEVLTVEKMRSAKGGSGTPVDKAQVNKYPPIPKQVS